MKNQAYNAALYLRISRDDAGAGDSGSIRTQRAMLEKYCEEQNIRVYDVYADDGFTGLNYERPEFQRMLSDIRAGFVNLVITKDLSRLGRDYIQTGYYTEIFFSRHDVRYIALGDNIDTSQDNNDVAPFKNILNDMYARDLSRKVKAAKRTRAAQGAFTGSQPPYGYKTRADGHNTLEIDEEAAETVRYIFRMALGGTGAAGIAKRLGAEKILTPSAYKVGRGDTRFAHLYEGKPEFLLYRWSYTTVRRILSDKSYIGHMVGHKSHVLNYKTKQRAAVPEHLRIVVKNTHPALVSGEDFERVQRLTGLRRPAACEGRENLFRGYVYCGECNRRLSISTKIHNGAQTRFYRCMHHYHRPDECANTHFLRYDDLYEIIRQDMSRINGMLAKHIDVIAASLYESNYQLQEMLNQETKRNRLQTRLKELDRLFDKLFEDSAYGRVNERNYDRLLEQYQREQDDARSELDALLSGDNAAKDPVRRAGELRAAVERQLRGSELNPHMLHELIDKIHVGHAQKTNGEKIQDISIKYRFSSEISDSVQ